LETLKELKCEGCRTGVPPSVKSGNAAVKKILRLLECEEFKDYNELKRV
jgi:hypothetical protein